MNPELKKEKKRKKNIKTLWKQNVSGQVKLLSRCDDSENRLSLY